MARRTEEKRTRRESGLVAVSKILGGPGGGRLQFFMVGSSALMVNPSAHWGYRGRPSVLRISREPPRMD